MSADGQTYKILKTLDTATTGGQTSAGVSLSPNGKTLQTVMSSGGAYNVGTSIALPIPADYR